MQRIGNFTLEWHEELGSTNLWALSLAANRNIELPRLIGATRQTSGRGRGANAWWSSEGALTFSLLFDPLAAGVPFPRWPQIALMTGLAVADTLEYYLPAATVQLKWPNDVYAAGRKICGILTEVPPGATDRLVVGIGLNIGNSLRDAPPDVQANATSLSELVASPPPSQEAVLTKLIEHWDRWLLRLAGDEIDFPALWRTKCFLTGEQISVTNGPDVQTGMCVGLDADGALLLDTDHGVRRIIAGTVRRLSN